MIYEKGLIKAMKQEHGKSDGYTVANDGQTTWVISSGWFAGVPNENLSNEIKSVIVLHFGRLPFTGEALSVAKKGDVQAELMETCMEVPSRVVDASGVRYMATYVRLGECLVFQDDALNCRMAHEDNLLPIDYSHTVQPLFATELVVPAGKWVETTPHGGAARPGVWTKKGKRTAKERSKTFPGIAAAMAAQWG